MWDRPLRRELRLTTNNTHKRQIFMLPAGFERKSRKAGRPTPYIALPPGPATDINAKVGNFKYLIKAKAAFVLYRFMRLGSYRSIISGRMQESNLKCYRLLLWLLILWIWDSKTEIASLTESDRFSNFSPVCCLYQICFLFSPYFTHILVANCVSNVFTAIVCQCFDVGKFQDICCKSYGEGFLRWNKQVTLKCMCNTISWYHVYHSCSLKWYQQYLLILRPYFYCWSWTCSFLYTSCSWTGSLS
jgi:hypothetical protein